MSTEEDKLEKMREWAYVQKKVREYKEVGLLQCDHSLSYNIEYPREQQVHLILHCLRCNNRIGSLDML